MALVLVTSSLKKGGFWSEYIHSSFFKDITDVADSRLDKLSIMGGPWKNANCTHVWSKI